MARLDQLAGAQLSYQAGASGTVTVPAGVVVVSVKAHATSAGSMTIAPGGANQVAGPVAGSSIPLPASADWFELNLLDLGVELGGSTQFVFTGTDSYLVVQAKQRNG